MAKTLAKRQMDFRATRKTEGGLRLDMWLPSAEAAKLKQLMVWYGKKSGPEVVMDLIREAWRKEVPEAATHGHADAQFEYGTFFAREDAPGPNRTRNILEAQHWYEESRQQGYRESAVYNNIGIMCWIFNQHIEAFEWFQWSAEEGNTVGLYNLGLLCLKGQGEPQPYHQVFEWFLKSGEQGFRLAQEVLGILYALGKGVPQNYEEAIAWLYRAVEEEFPTYICELALADWLAAYPDDDCGIRNGQLAITIAENLLQQQSGSIIEVLYTLAKAYAETERFDDAIKTIKKIQLILQRGRPHKYQFAISIDCKRSLSRYMAKKPWRDAERFPFCWDFGFCVK